MKRYGFDGIRLGEQLKVSDATVSTWTRGLNYPKIQTFGEISKLFETTIDEMFFTDVSLKQEELENKKQVKLDKPKNMLNEDQQIYGNINSYSKESDLYREIINGRDREIELLKEMIKYLEEQLKLLK